ncbi:hypothetical protein GCM10023321_05770 [Pseudonocardia eucalypti]|uniref:HTH tetR-type domain-containing protein n=1 Tax=Pseudonocardia eucalypti TaxID=648755 RepID=A0ABP9PGX9_9PSEU|nr:AcrR family transcriptional regulator [Pseudonocardia eucalypti]
MANEAESAGSSSERARAPRRAPGEVRELLLESAKQMFSRHGYDYSSTKRIAERAGVAEALLFRHFGSKAQLFREAIVEPMVTTLQAYADQWSGYDRPHQVESPVHDFVKTFFGTLSDRRGSALALTAVSNYSTDIVTDAGAPLANVLTAIEKIVVQEAAQFGYSGLNPPITGRVGVGSVLAAAVFRSWLFDRIVPESTDDDLIAELQTMLIHGVRNRPA